MHDKCYEDVITPPEQCLVPIYKKIHRNICSPKGTATASSVPANDIHWLRIDDKVPASKAAHLKVDKWCLCFEIFFHRRQQAPATAAEVDNVSLVRMHSARDESAFSSGLENFAEVVGTTLQTKYSGAANRKLRRRERCGFANNDFPSCK